MLSEWWVYLPLLASVGLSRVVKKHLPQREPKALTNESWKVGLEFGPSNLQAWCSRVLLI